MSDIINGRAGHYIVVGFFTPNYRPLAARLALNLSQYKVPHHFYEVGPEAWNRAVLLKPQIVLRAMSDYPGVTVALFDVDCIVRGSIDSLFAFDGDVALALRVKRAPLGTKVWLSDRVAVFKPTSGAKRLAEAWLKRCATPGNGNSEGCLLSAIATTPGIPISTIDHAFAAKEFDEVSDVIIAHESQHSKTRFGAKWHRKLKLLRRALVEKIIGKNYRTWKYGDAA